MGNWWEPSSWTGFFLKIRFVTIIIKDYILFFIFEQLQQKCERAKLAYDSAGKYYDIIIYLLSRKIVLKKMYENNDTLIVQTQLSGIVQN